MKREKAFITHELTRVGTKLFPFSYSISFRLDFVFLISRMETINKFDKTRVDILNFRQERFIVKDHMSL